MWLLGAAGALGALGKARRYLRKARYPLAAGMVAVAVGTLSLTLSLTDAGPALAAADPLPVNQPVGIAQGIHPGRVVWVRDKEAVDWVGPHTGTLWYQRTDQQVVSRMLERAVMNLSGEDSVAAAWDALFRHYNRTHGRGDVGYQAGEKIAIKTNHTLCGESDPMRMGKPWEHADNIGNSPQLTVALLRQLVVDAGVPAEQISIGDPSRIMPNFYYNAIQRHEELRRVVCLTRYGSPVSGRRLVSFSDVPVVWSDPEPRRLDRVTAQDHIPTSFAEADYVVNFAILKSHEMNGITLCAKNHYGSLIRNPIAYDDPLGRQFYDMHQTLPTNLPGMGHYRAVVDLMGHPELGGKTVLYLIDGLIAGEDWEGRPSRWQMAPFDGDWPESIFVSQDAVAIDSVGFDFLRTEWSESYPSMSGTADYLREAALAGSPISGALYDPDGDGQPMDSLGVYEHWNNPEDKQYSRNLGTGAGIELVPLMPGD
ncbi:MAG: DUF362 domain-containing protein [Candidatus Brocadiia bacterium]